MSAEVKNTAHAYLKARLASALANRNSMVGLFTRNTQIKHGIPHEDNAIDVAVLSSILTAPAPPTKPVRTKPLRDNNATIQIRPTPPNPDANPPARPAPAVAQPSWISKAAPWIAGAGIGAAIAAFSLSGDDPPAPPAAGAVVPVPVEPRDDNQGYVPPPPAAPVENPLLWLDETGRNQP